MSRYIAVEDVEVVVGILADRMTDSGATAIKQVIDIVESLPSIEIVGYWKGELIGRQEAIDALRIAYFDKNIQSAKDDPCIVDAMTDWAIRQIKSLPSADRPTGKWKRRIVDNGFNADWKCSVCGYRVMTDFVNYNYCPNCGARMKGASNE